MIVLRNAPLELSLAVALAASGCGAKVNPEGGDDTPPVDAPTAPDDERPFRPDGAVGHGADWITSALANAPVVTGTLMTRKTIETPALVKDATNCCAKYAFDIRETTAPNDLRVGFVNVNITNLTSSDAYGGGIQTSGAPGVSVFMANV